MGAGVSMVPGEGSSTKSNQLQRQDEANMKNKDGAKESLASKSTSARKHDNEVSVRAESKASVRIKPGSHATTANPISEVSKRRVSLQECFTPAGTTTILSPRETVFDRNSTHITVGDIVRVEKSPNSFSEGIIVERLDNEQFIVDFGDRIATVLLSNCHILLRNDEYEMGDKVEVQPPGSALFFVGRVIAMNPHERTLDVLMDGDDPDDIERNIPIENARKLMSRRAVVVNRWKKAFMMVVASNFFRQVEFDEASISEKYP